MENGKWTMENLLFSLLILFLPTQFGKHFWPSFSIIQGIRVDYLSPTLYFTDILIILLFLVWLINNLLSPMWGRSRSEPACYDRGGRFRVRGKISKTFSLFI